MNLLARRTFRRHGEQAGLSYERFPAECAGEQWGDVLYGRLDGSWVYTGDITLDGLRWHESGLFVGNVPDVTVMEVDGSALTLQSAYSILSPTARGRELMNGPLGAAVMRARPSGFAVSDGWLSVRRPGSSLSFEVSVAQWSFLHTVRLLLPTLDGSGVPSEVPAPPFLCVDASSGIVAS